MLSSFEASREFIRNPRPYLVSPQPVMPVRIAIVGHLCAGVSSMTRLIAERYNASWISLNDILQAELIRAKKKFMRKVREDTTAKTIKNIVDQRKREADEIRTSLLFKYYLLLFNSRHTLIKNLYFDQMYTLTMHWLSSLTSL